MAKRRTASGAVSTIEAPRKRAKVKRAKPVKRKSPLENGRDNGSLRIDPPARSDEPQPGAEMLVPVADIRPSPFQPRKTFAAEYIEALAASIQAVGLLQSPVCRLVDGAPELVCGERRIRAIKSLGWRQVKVSIRELTDEQAAAATIAENLDRKDLDPFEEAEAFSNWIAQFGKTQQECAAQFSLTQGQISNRLRLLRLEAPWRAEVTAGRVTIKQARQLATWAETLPKFQEAVWKEWEGALRAHGTDELPISDEYFSEDVILAAITEVTRPIGGTGHWNSQLGKNEPRFKPKADQREELGIVTITIPQRWGVAKPEGYATNVALWDELQAAHIAKLLAKKKGKPAPEVKAGAASARTTNQPISAAEKKAREREAAERRKKADEVLAKRAAEWRTNWLRRLIHARLEDDGWRMQIARRLALHLICDTNFDTSRRHLAERLAGAIKARGGKPAKSGYYGVDVLGSVCDLALDEQDVEDLLHDVLAETLVDTDTGEPSAALSTRVVDRLAEFCNFDLAEQWRTLWHRWHARHAEGEFCGELFAAMNKEQLAAYGELAKVPKQQLSGKKDVVIEAIRRHVSRQSPPLPSQVKRILDLRLDISAEMKDRG